MNLSKKKSTIFLDFVFKNLNFLKKIQNDILLWVVWEYNGTGPRRQKQKMRWRYGIIKHKNEKGDYFAVHEIYLEDNKTSWTKEPIQIVGEKQKDLKLQLNNILRDLENESVITVNESNEIVS